MKKRILIPLIVLGAIVLGVWGAAVSGVIPTQYTSAFNAVITSIRAQFAEAPVPPWAVDLPEGENESRAEYNRRLIADFPLGTGDKALKKALNKFQFKVYPIPTGQPGGAAIREMMAPECKTTYMVAWHSDNDGKLTHVSGNFKEECGTIKTP